MSGKKIFFLYPSALIQNEIAWELVQQEYEIYHVHNHERLRKVLRNFPDSIVFINLDDGLPEKSWDVWIQAVSGDPALRDVKMGVLSMLNAEERTRKYETGKRLPGGFTEVDRADTLKTVKRLYGILQALDARGRRKYLRAAPEHEAMTAVNIPRDNAYFKGVVKDISVAGMSCAFQVDPCLEKNTLCQNIQIKLQTALLKAEAVCFGARHDGHMNIYVFLFTQRIDPDVKIKIRTWVQAELQVKMDGLLK